MPAPSATALLEWYDVHARRLPWRVSPEDRALGLLPDPYRIWLSEVMLQQTADSDLKPAGIPINYRPPFRFEAGHYSNQLPAGSRL